MTEKLLRLRAVMDMVSLSKSTIYFLQGNGSFPQARRISPRCVAWNSTEVQAWINSRAERNASA